MSEKKRVLVLHLSSGGEPLLVAVGDDADELGTRLPALMSAGQVESVTAANGQSIAINFGHVLAAHVDRMPGMGQILGSPPRDR
jgi:hypothetical protein